MKNVEDIHPLSPMQQGMLFHTLYSPQAGIFFEQFTCKLTGDIDAGLLRRAWQQVLDRHQILRTAFLWEGLDEPLQVVRQRVTLPWTELDWSGLSPEELERRFDELLEEDRRRGFKLNVAPLIRVAVVKLPGGGLYMVFSFDHLLLDGWSMPLLVKEVFTLYRAYARGEEPRLPRPQRYRDYIEWLQRQDSADAEAFWRRTLAGFTEPTPLAPGRRGGKATGEEEFAEHFVTLSDELTASLREMARAQQVTLNTVVQGAWALLLSRYAGRGDVLFGAVVSGRPADLPGVESMVGLFINTLPVRARLTESEPAGAWLRRLQSEQAEARQYEHSPLVQVQAWGETPRGSQLFESVLSFQNYPVDPEAGGSTIEIREVHTKERPTFPLNLKVMVDGRLSYRFVYDSARFEAEEVERMGLHLKNILRGFALAPAAALGTLSLSDEDEGRRLRAMWAGPRSPYGEGGGECAHRLFEQQVGRTPGATALLFEDVTLSYAELNARANRLAHHLMSYGVGPELLVGVCMDNPLDAVVGMLAVLKAGGAYLPLDLTNPLERLSFMIEDAGVAVLLTREDLVDRLPTGMTYPVCIDAESELIEQQPAENPTSGVTPDNLAYVIYTSGSTGRPKGVLVPHAGVGNLAAAQRAGFDLDARSVVLQFASFNFDASVSEVFVTLLAGATLCLGTRESLMPGPALIKTMRERGVTCVTLPPPVLAVLPSEGLPALRTVVSAGEACSAEIIERWGAGRRFVNAYGPTETTVCATMAVNPPAADHQVIGTPIDNTECVVLDAQMRPAPLGVVGELYVGGGSLARGYLNRPGLTAERFIPHPFNTEPGARLYRTGDLASYSAGGRIQYFGRADQQVKIRGFRVELGEIEQALKSCAGVRDCAVVVREDAPGDKRLTAYVVGEGGGAADARDLRRQLKDVLPEYMVPAAFVGLDALPLNSSGKVDRRALPAPAAPGQEAAEAFVPPRTPVEELLAQIWAEVLRVERVGRDDNFFELSGHSLLATQVVFRVKEALGVELPLRCLFDAPVLSGLAAVVEQSRESGSADGAGGAAAPGSDEAAAGRRASSWQRELMVAATLVPIRGEGTKRPFFCVHPASGNVFGFAELARLLDADRPFYGLQSRGLAEGFEPQKSVGEMAALYLEAVRGVQPEGPYLLGGWSMGASVAFEMARLLEEQGQRVALLALMDARAPRSEGFHIDAEEESLLDGFALDLALSWSLPRLSWDRFFGLPAAGKLAYALEEAKAASLLPAGFGDPDLRPLFEVFKWNVRALAAYDPRPYPRALTLFAASASEEASGLEKGWGALAAGVTRVEVPGNHHSMMRAPHVGTLALQLRNSIELALGPGEARPEMSLAYGAGEVG